MKYEILQNGVPIAECYSAFTAEDIAAAMRREFPFVGFTFEKKAES